METLPPSVNGVRGRVGGSETPHRNDCVSGDDENVNRPVWPTEPHAPPGQPVGPSRYTSEVTVGSAGWVMSTCHSQLSVTSDERNGA